MTKLATRKIDKERLRKEVWEKDSYYRFAQEGSFNISHPGMRILKNLSEKTEKILDLGCGEGTRLNYLIGKNKKGVGIDISRTAINLARKKYSNLQFVQADLARIPLKDNSFDLVYSAFVLEHISDHNKALNEGIRVIQKRGYFVLIAPNYGSPNRSSPPFKGSRLKKLIKGFSDDLSRLSRKIDHLVWNKVTPMADAEKYEMDWDTTIEPYMGTLIEFLKSKNMKIIKATSCWSEELSGAKPHQVLFRILGKLRIYPFWMWGPHFVVVAQK